MTTATAAAIFAAGPEATADAIEVARQLHILKAEALAATATRSFIQWDKAYDKYRRPCVQVDRIHVAANGEWVGRDRDLAVVVTLPKACAPERYLVNVRGAGADGRGEVTYHTTRRAAIAYAESRI